MTLADIIKLTVFTASIYAAAYIPIREMRSKHPGWIPTIWYVFGLAGSVTFVVASWAHHTGALDPHGNPHGPAGERIMWLLSFVLNLNDDMRYIGTLVFLVVVPQIISYGLSAPFGCATKPVFIGPIITFATWFLAKSFVTAAGVFVSAALFGMYFGWPGFGWADVAKLLVLAAWLAPIAFLFLYFDYESSEVIVGQSKLSPNFTRRLRQLHRCATRHHRRPRQDSSVASFRLEQDGIFLVLRPKAPVVTIRIGGLVG